MFCPKNEESWCKYSRTKEVAAKVHYLDPVFLDFLLPLFTRLSEHSLLLRCLPYSQNKNESLNGIVWSKAPKHKYKGPNFSLTVVRKPTRRYDHSEDTTQWASSESRKSQGQDKNDWFCKKSQWGAKKEKSCLKAGKTCKRARSKRKGRWSILCQRRFQWEATLEPKPAIKPLVSFNKHW